MRKGLIVGINYTGTGSDLRGCINDANNINQMLLSEFAFDETKLVLEKEATTQGIMDGLRWLVAGAVPGDVLVFHYSGHGSQIRSTIEPDGLDEIICPIDLNWRDKVITDNELKQVFNGVPNGVNVTVILDCCHSGSGLDQDNTMEAARVQLHQEEPLKDGEGSRFLPMPAEVEAYIRDEQLELREFVTSRDVNRSALLIAGCMPHQTSADAFIDGTYQGAASYALRKALLAGKDTYRDIVTFMNDFMVANRFTQRPQLDGHPSLYDQAFLEPWGTLFGQPTETPPPGTWVEPVETKPEPVEVEAPTSQTSPSQENKVNNTWVWVAIAVMVFIGLIVAS